MADKKKQDNSNAMQEMRKRMGKKQVFARLCTYLLQHAWLLGIAFVLVIVSNSLALIGPKLSGYAIDAISLGEGKVDFDAVYHFCGLMLLFYVISSGLSYILSRVMIHLSQRVVYQLRKEVFHKLTELPVGYFDTHATGDIISKISYDIDTISDTLCQDFLQIATSIIAVGGSFFMMVGISTELLVVFVITIPISIFVTRYMSKKVRPLFRKRSAKLGELNGFVEEIISGQKTIKAYSREEVMKDRFSEKNNETVEAYYRADFFGSAVGPSVNFVNNLSLALISMFGSILYLKGMLSLGNVSTFILYSRRFSGPINEMANIISELQSALSAAERVFNLLDSDTEVKDVDNATELENVQGDVELNHVQFGYTPEKRIIHDLNLQAKSGSLVAIVGPTGAGKTTIINLLMRFYDPDSGYIAIDGKKIVQLTRKSLRLSYAMVLQDTWLFQGTVFENIAYGKADATLQEIEEVAKAAHIHDYIMSLPEGYNTILNEDGGNISQGQKQLLTIARAMLLDAKMLILDEATSNVDTRTEIKIQEAMRRLMQGKTCFVIAHRLSTIKNADEILVVQDGDIVEQGDHNQLLTKGGVYATMYNSQF